MVPGDFPVIHCTKIPYSQSAYLCSRDTVLILIYKITLHAILYFLLKHLIHHYIINFLIARIDRGRRMGGKKEMAGIAASL